MKNLTVWVGILALCLMTGARADEGSALAKQALAKAHNPRAALATLRAQLKMHPNDEALLRWRSGRGPFDLLRIAVCRYWSILVLKGPPRTMPPVSRAAKV